MKFKHSYMAGRAYTAAEAVEQGVQDVVTYDDGMLEELKHRHAGRAETPTAQAHRTGRLLV